MKKRVSLSQWDKVYPANELAQNIVSVAVDRGAEIESLLRGTGIFQQDILKGKLVSAGQLHRLLANANSLSSGYDTTFQIGNRLIENHPSKLLDALVHCKNLAECLKVISVLQTQLSPFVSSYFKRDEEWGYLIFQDASGIGKLMPEAIEIYLSAIVSLFKLCLGRRILFHFYFPFPRPRHIPEYEENLGFRLRFDQPLFMAKFPISEFSQSFLHANTRVKRYALRTCIDQRHCKETFLDLVRRLLRENISLNLPLAASEMGMSVSTFKRKLKDHGKNFKQIHDEIRCQQAICCLQFQRLNNEQSANKLSISDVTNFRRAVKRWTGFTPSELREVAR